MDKLVSLVLRFSGTGFTLLTTIVLTRKWGLEATGAFFLFYSMYRLVSGILSSFFIRRTIRDVAKEDSSKWHELGHQIFNDKVMFCLLILLLVFPFSLVLARYDLVSPVIPLVLVSSFLCIGLQFTGSMLQGTFRPNMSILVEFVCIPFLFLIGLLVAPVSVAPITLHVFALLVASIVTLLLSFSRISFSKLRVHFPKIDAEDYSFIGTRMVNVVQNNAIMLVSPFVLSDAQIGIVGVLLRFYTVSNGILGGLSANYSPKFSRAYHNGNHQTLSKLFKESQLHSVVSYLPLIFAYAFFGNLIAKFMHLEGLIEHLLIGIGLIGFINVFTNLSGSLLLVSSQQKSVLKINVISLITLMLLYVPLVKLFSLWGFVAAFGFYQLTKQGLLYLRGRVLLRDMQTQNDHPS